MNVGASVHVYRVAVDASATQGRPLSWGPGEQEAVAKLTESLCHPPLVALPDFGRVFIAYSDASDGGLGAVLPQVYEGREKPVAFLSRALTVHERITPCGTKNVACCEGDKTITFVPALCAVRHAHGSSVADLSEKHEVP